MTLEIRGLTKTYPNGVRALNGIDLSTGKGLFGLLGPNGAGKSSLMRTLATLQLPDSGSITFGEIDVLARPDALRRVLGYLPQEFGLYPNLSAEVTLDHFATLKGIAERGARKALVAHLLNQVNLYQVHKKHVGTFSGGMKQRLGIAIALAGCLMGLRTSGGAEGVGRNTTRAVVLGCVAILVLDAFWAMVWLLGRAR